MKPTTLRYLQTAMFTLLCSFAFAQRADYKYVKPIPQTQEGWNKFNIGNEINSKVNSNFSDIRIYEISSNDTLEISYILNRQTTQATAPTFIPATISNITVWKNEQASFVAELAKTIRLNEIKLTFQEQNFDASVSVSGSQDLKTWEIIAENQRIVGIRNASADFSFTTVSFPNAQYKYYKFNVHSATPLNISTVKVLDEMASKTSPTNKDTFATQNIQKQIDKKQKSTTYSVNFDKAIYADAVTLHFDQSNEFTRNASVYRIVDSVQSEKGWIYTEELLSNSSIASFANNTLKFAPTLIGQLKIVIQNGDNPSLNLSRVNAIAPIYSIFTKLKPDANFFLYFGNPKAEVPDYDLIHFVDQIPDSVNVVTLGQTITLAPNATNETVNQPTSFLSNPITLWTILILIILIIGWFSVKMLLKKET